jgi:hypothetical protein
MTHYLLNMKKKNKSKGKNCTNLKDNKLIPRRLERRTYSYQKHTLPIKLRNPVYL